MAEESVASNAAPTPGLVGRVLHRFGLDAGVPAYVAAIVALMVALVLLGGRE